VPLQTEYNIGFVFSAPRLWSASVEKAGGCVSFSPMVKLREGEPLVGALCK
jgi:hypothetical protein